MAGGGGWWRVVAGGGGWWRVVAGSGNRGGERKLRGGGRDV